MSDLKNIRYRFPDGRFKVLTMSYDDGAVWDRKLIEIFNKNKIRGTFHLNSGRLGDGYSVTAEEIPELYRGHEVSSHTVLHPAISYSPISQTVQQIIEDRKTLEDACGYVVRGMSYPFGMVNDEILAALPGCGIEYSRTTASTGAFSVPENFLRWNPSCHHKGALELADTFLDLWKDWNLAVFYVWGHSYEFDGDKNWELIERFCEKMGGRDDIWYATNIEIVDYINALRALKFTARADRVYNPTATDVWIWVDGEVAKIDAGKTVNL